MKELTGPPRERNKFRFPARLIANPMVQSAYTWMNDYYAQVKNANVLINRLCGLTEAAWTTSVNLSEPYVQKYESNLTALDNMACSQLDLVEALTPSSLGLQSVVNGSKAVATQVASQAIGLGEQFVESMLNFDQISASRAERSDKPSVFKRNKKLWLANKSNATLMKRLVLLSFILFNFVQFKFIQLMYAVQPYVANVLHLANEYKTKQVDQIKLFLKDRFHITKENVDFYKDYMRVLGKQFTVSDGRSIEHIHSMEERTMIILRRTVGNIVIAYCIVGECLSHVKQAIVRRLDAVSSVLLSVLNSHFNRDGKLIFSLRQRATELTSWLYKCANSIGEPETFVSLFVPNFDTFGILDIDDCDGDAELLDATDRQVIPRASYSAQTVAKTSPSTARFIQDIFTMLHYRNAFTSHLKFN